MPNFHELPSEEKTLHLIAIFEKFRMAVEHPGPEAKMHRHMKMGDPGAKESVEDFLKRMEHIISGDITGMSLISRQVWQ